MAENLELRRSEIAQRLSDITGTTVKHIFSKMTVFQAKYRKNIF